MSLRGRKRKEQLRKCIRQSLAWHQGLTKASEIKYLYDDYDYWCAREAHKILHPNTPDEFYLCKKRLSIINNMWERLYQFMHHINSMIELYPDEKHFTVEMDVDLYRFANEIGFIPDNGIFKFKDCSFILG